MSVLENDMIKKIIFNHSLAIQFSDYNHFHRHGSGKIVLVLGVSTSGKSTFIKEFKKLNSRFLDFSIDRMFWVRVGHLIKERFPIQYKAIREVASHENIFKIVYCGDKLRFKKGASNKSKIMASDALSDLKKRSSEIQCLLPKSSTEHWEFCFKKIIHASSLGRSVIFDLCSLDTLRFFFEKRYHAPIRIVLLYYPLAKLIDRIKSRNLQSLQKEEPSNYRPPFLFLKFSDLYRKKQHDAQMTLEIVDRRTIQQQLDELQPISPSKKSIEALDVSKGQFIDKFGLISIDTEKIEIVCQFELFHFCVHMDMYDKSKTLALKRLVPDKFKLTPALERQQYSIYMQYSLRLHFYEHHHFHRYGKGNIIILLGVSTSGKTTLVHELQKIQPDWLDYGFSYRYWIKAGQMLRQHASEEYRNLIAVTEESEIFKIFQCGDKIQYKRKITLEEKESAENAVIQLKNKNASLQKYLPKNHLDACLEEIISLSQRGRSVILDMHSIEQLVVFFSKNFHAPIQVVLVFCPLVELFRRLKHRNVKALQTGMPSNVRQPQNLFFQYSKLYKSKKMVHEPSVEVINKEDLEMMFREVKIECDKQSKLIEDFGFSSVDHSAQMTPQFKNYDLLINSSESTPYENVLKILRLRGSRTVDM